MWKNGANMIKIAICDDNNLELTNIVHMMQHFQESHSEWLISIFTFTSAKKLLETIATENFHILLLDIIMPEMNGILLGKAIRERNIKTPIIYFSSSADFAVQSYSVNAFYYLLKPIEESALFSVLDEALAQYTQINTMIQINARDGSSLLNKKKIVYVEYHYHYLTYHLANDKTIDSRTSRCSFNEMAEALLLDYHFTKISASMLVNLSYVEKISTKGFIMRDNKELIITRTYSDAKIAYFDFLFKEGLCV